MTRSIPAILSRAAFVDVRTGILTREGALLLDALRSAVGGDAATVTPVEPLGALTPVSVLQTAVEALSPVSAVRGDTPDFAPVAALAAATDLAPVCGCAETAGFDPVAPMGPEALP